MRAVLVFSFVLLTSVSISHAGSAGDTPVVLNTLGYFKASNTEADDEFGRAVKLSLDGRTLAVASHDDSNATGVNGDEADNSSRNSGAVYVFRRVGGEWRQEAFLKAGVNQPGTYFGVGYPLSTHNIGVSGDGSVIAVGSAAESVEGAQFAGAVYLFTRAANGTWSQALRLVLPQPRRHDFYGVSVDLSSDANTLKVTSLNPRDGKENAEGQTWVYQRVGGSYSLDTHIPSTPNDFCSSILSGDGSTLINFCYSHENPGPRLKTFKRIAGEWVRQADIPFANFSAQVPALSHDGRRLAFRLPAGLSEHQVQVFRWTDAGWVADGIVREPEGATSAYNTFASSVAFNANGNVLAISDYANTNGGAGMMNAPVTGDAGNPVTSGAVYLFSRQPGTAVRWALTRVVKSPHPAHGYGFGLEISLDGSGRTLAVGSPWEGSAATGIEDDATDAGAPQAGAVFLY